MLERKRFRVGSNSSDDLFSSQMFAARGKGDPLVGTRIDEYRLDAVLGSGGMARVYRAVDVNLDRTVAIKIIDTPYQADAEYARRFKREAQAIAQLEHPHIVRLYRYGQSEALFYMSMQFIRGVNLGELWRLSELADWLRASNRSRFLLTAPPLRLPGAVGSPVTPVATV